MAKLVISENGKEYPVNYRLLVAIAKNLPEDDIYDDLVDELLELNVYSITEQLIERFSFRDNRRDALWDSGDINIRRLLANNERFVASLTDEQAEEIIKMNDAVVLTNIASNADMLLYDAELNHKGRLSEYTCEKLLNFMHKNDDPIIRTIIENNTSLPAKYHTEPQKYIAHGIESKININDISEKDLITIQNAAYDVLKYIATNINLIEDANLQLEIAKILLQCNEPSIRCALASNPLVPLPILRLMLNDKEYDVFSYAECLLRTHKYENSEQIDMLKHDDTVLYNSVLEYAKVNSKISSKAIMWRYQIDNNRASRMYERLEKDGIVNDRGEVLNMKLEL